MPIINNVNELNERITFIQMVPNDGPEPGEGVEKEVFSCWAKVRTAYIKDVKASAGTDFEDTIEIVIRQQQKEPVKNDMQIKWQGKYYDIVETSPDYAEKAYMVLVIKARN